MSIRTFILLTLAISAFGYFTRNKYGDSIKDRVETCKNTRGDIVFIIDGSRSNHIRNFNKLIAFLKIFVSYFTIGNDCVRFGAVTFGDKIILNNTFPLAKYTTKDQLEEGISKIHYRPEDGSSTETHLAIRYAREILFKDARPYAKKIAILITDGKPTEPLKTEKEAKKMKGEGILIFEIDVDPSASEKELRTLTGREDYFINNEGYFLLKTVQDELACNGNVDINFVFDSSMMSYKDTQDVSSFISKVIPVRSPNDMFQYGITTGKCQPIKGFHLNTYQNRREIIAQLDGFTKTSIRSLLKQVLDVSFAAEYGGRNGARKVAVVFLKGKLSDPEGVSTYATALRKSGVEVFIVKLDNLNSDEILATITEQGNILDTASAIHMKQLTGEFLNKLCRR